MILKAGSKLKEIKEKASSFDKHIYLVENCGMPNERVYFELNSMPNEAGYFSLVIVR